jgi:hypothetical protein
MHTTLAPGRGKNGIVIIQANSINAYLFPLQLLYDPNSPNDVEVRDFHYNRSNDTYVLCGSRQLDLVTRAFVAVIDGNFTQMDFFEYSVADMFYSICIPDANYPIPAFNNYYLCGTRGNYGVITSVDRVTLQLTNFYATTTEWEYHKIIVSNNFDTQDNPHFVASGRNPQCTQIGFTTLNASFIAMNSYRWAQMTEPNSHCVVSDDVMANNAVIIASSYQNIVTLNPVTFLILPALVRAYRFNFQLTDTYYVQDIGAVRFTNNTFRISVAGFSRNLFIAPAHAVAWHGYITGLSTFNNMRSNSYHGVFGDFEHYKIRYKQGQDYTGGYCQKVNEMYALFATPLTLSDCDNDSVNYPDSQTINWDTFSLLQSNTPYTPKNTYLVNSYSMLSDSCPPFKGAEPAPELIMPTENGSEIITFYDRITVKDTPTNTHYQIYTITGQLLQTGATTPDISTVQLSKGIYILRLENGKTFKFMK